MKIPAIGRLAFDRVPPETHSAVRRCRFGLVFLTAVALGLLATEVQAQRGVSPDPAPAQVAPAKPDTPAPQQAPAAAPKAPGTAATVLNLQTVEGVMGKSVRSRTNEDMGRIVDVLVDGGGQIRAAVIDFGGFLGVGSRKVAVAWKTLDFSDSIKSGSVKVTLTRDQVRQSPEYKPDEPVVILEGATSKPESDKPPQKPAGDAAQAKPGDAPSEPADELKQR